MKKKEKKREENISQHTMVRLEDIIILALDYWNISLRMIATSPDYTKNVIRRIIRKRKRNLIEYE